MGGRVWWGRYKDVGQVADGLLHEVCLSRFSLSMCKRCVIWAFVSLFSDATHRLITNGLG